MRTLVFVALALALVVPVIALAPAVSAAPPNLPPGSTGCGFFHYHHGDVKSGELPGYHYHHCL